MMTKVDGNPAANSSFRGPLFVVGMWRSGTSLLYALLNQNPQIALLYEGDLPLLRALFRGGRTKADWRERWEFWNGALSRHKISGRANGAEPQGIRETVELAYREYAGDAIWGCKSPNYYDAMAQLAQDFPDARFVVIFRNPADICRSIVRAGRKASWFSRPGMSLRAVLGYREMKQQTDLLGKMGARLHTLQYEELVREPEQELRKICAFLEIPYDERMATLAQAERSAIYNAEHHSGVKGTAISAAGPRAEVLPEALRRKILRYQHMWREQSNGTWPQYPEPGEPSGGPGWFERVSDAGVYRALRAFDSATAVIYSNAPLSWLRAYRGMKAREPEFVKQEGANQKESLRSGNSYAD